MYTRLHPNATGQWFARDEGDGQLVRVLYPAGQGPPGSSPANPRRYKLVVTTSDIK
jgi:hypothetical protein